MSEKKIFYCNWCGKPWHSEIKCFKKQANKLPEKERRREQITHGILKQFLYEKKEKTLKKYFDNWPKKEKEINFFFQKTFLYKKP
jgi:ribosomal protein L44E